MLITFFVGKPPQLNLKLQTIFKLDCSICYEIGLVVDFHHRIYKYMKCYLLSSIQIYFIPWIIL